MIHLVRYETDGDAYHTACVQYLDVDSDEWATPGAFAALYEVCPLTEEYPTLCPHCTDVFATAPSTSPWVPR